MRGTVLLLVGASAVVGGCRKECGDETGPTDPALANAVIQEADGRFALYAGRDIKPRLARGEPVDAPTSLPSFLRVRMPASLLREVHESPRHRRILSLEDPYPGLEITYHTYDHRSAQEDEDHCVRLTRAENWVLSPGQPWLSGHVIVQELDDGRNIAGAHLLTYSGTLPLGGADVSEGMVGCSPTDPATPDCPPLKYDDPDPCRWPPLPPGWSLVPLMGQSPDLDVVCGRKPR
jgi:hypothetical protein